MSRYLWKIGAISWALFATATQSAWAADPAPGTELYKQLRVCCEELLDPAKRSAAADKLATLAPDRTGAVMILLSEREQKKRDKARLELQGAMSSVGWTAPILAQLVDSHQGEEVQVDGVPFMFGHNLGLGTESGNALFTLAVTAPRDPLTVERFLRFAAPWAGRSGGGKFVAPDGSDASGDVFLKSYKLYPGIFTDTAVFTTIVEVATWNPSKRGELVKAIAATVDKKGDPAGNLACVALGQIAGRLPSTRRDITDVLLRACKQDSLRKSALESLGYCADAAEAQIDTIKRYRFDSMTGVPEACATCIKLIQDRAPVARALRETKDSDLLALAIEKAFRNVFSDPAGLGYERGRQFNFGPSDLRPGDETAAAVADRDPALWAFLAWIDRSPRSRSSFGVKSLYEEAAFEKFLGTVPLGVKPEQAARCSQLFLEWVKG